MHKIFMKKQSADIKKTAASPFVKCRPLKLFVFIMLKELEW